MKNVFHDQAGSNQAYDSYILYRLQHSLRGKLCKVALVRAADDVCEVSGKLVPALSAVSVLFEVWRALVRGVEALRARRSPVKGLEGVRRVAGKLSNQRNEVLVARGVVLVGEVEGLQEGIEELGPEEHSQQVVHLAHDNGAGGLFDSSVDGAMDLERGRVVDFKGELASFERTI